MNKTLLIIGGGVAGLAAGCYGEMNGFKTVVIEANGYAGGACTSWRREGYEFNGCIHWLLGGLPGSGYHQLWTELGALKNIRVVPLNVMRVFEFKDGTKLVFYCNPDRLEAHLKEIAPEDSELIDELCQGIRDFSENKMEFTHPIELSGAFEQIAGAIENFGFIKNFIKWDTETILDYALKFKSPYLKEAIRYFWEEDMTRMMIPFVLSWFNNGWVGYPEGGSRPFIKNIVDKYKSLGGTFRFDSKAQKIIIENGTAVGVRLADGDEIRADYVISAIDRYETFFGLLGDPYISPETAAQFRDAKRFTPICYFSAGVKRSFEGITTSGVGLSLPLSKPLETGKITSVNRLTFQIYAHDATLAAPGHTVVTAIIESDYHYWQDLVSDNARYEAEKARIIAAVVVELDARFPGISQEIEALDLATPHTYRRFIGVYEGAYEGWLPEPGAFRQKVSRTAPGLKNFYHCGQWTTATGGLPVSAQTGKEVLQLICAKENIDFEITIN